MHSDYITWLDKSRFLARGTSMISFCDQFTRQSLEAARVSKMRFVFHVP